MLSRLRFYARHSVNDMRVNGQRTLFAVLCIAAGVAAIVSLQTLGVMIEDTLLASLQESNLGDIRIDAQLNDLEISEESGGQVAEDELVRPASVPTELDYFPQLGLEQLRTWMESNFPGQVETVTYNQTLGSFNGVGAPERGTSSPFAFPFMVDADVFPLYGDILAEDGRALAEVIQQPTDIAMSETLAERLAVQVGDQIRVSGATETFTLSGIIADTAGSFGENIGLALLGYYYLDQSAMQYFPDIETQAATVYWRLEDPSLATEINAALLERYPYLTTTTTDDLAQQNEEISNGIIQLVSVMGLLSMLIGGIGIVNTMQVIVRRRTLEVAVLKTIGLEAYQITVLFLVEAFLMGLVGSMIGIVVGWGFTAGLMGVAEAFLAQDLTFRITAGPAVTGLVVGVLVTTVFGFLPTLSAGQVRPGLVLRPNEDTIPKAGRLRSILALAVVMVALVIIAAGFIGPIAAAVVPAAFVTVGILYGVLSLVIWAVGRFFPSFGLVDLKIALRSMLAARPRGASTLLALVVGVFTLSVITLLTGTILQQFQTLLVQEMGGNVLVFAPAQGDTIDRIEGILEDAEGVNSYATVASYSVQLVSIEDAATGETETREEILNRVDEAGFNMPFGGGPEETQPSDFIDLSFSMLDAREVDSNLPELPLLAGRQLNASDAGKQVMIFSKTDLTEPVGVEVGDKITFAFTPSRLRLFGLGSRNPPAVTYEVVGVLDRPMGATSPTASLNYAPIGAFPEDITPSTISAVVDVDETSIDTLRRELQSVPGIFVIETKLLNDLVNAFVDQFTTFPILVAALSLLVGGIVIANSVALTTLERRREIAVMKAIGLQRERVLGMLLLENGVMGLIGGLIGVGIGIVMLLAILTMLFQGIDRASVPYLTALGLMALCVVIALAAAMLSAWGASGEKPLNVLRYE